MPEFDNTSLGVKAWIWMKFKSYFQTTREMWVVLLQSAGFPVYNAAPPTWNCLSDFCNVAPDFHET